MGTDPFAGLARRARLLSVLLLSTALLFVASFAVLHRFGTPTQKLADCPRLVDPGLREECLRRSLTGMVAADSPGAAASSLRTLLESEPPSSDLHRLCHTATHAAGSERTADRETLASFLASSDAGVCEWGLAHGLLTALIATSPSGGDLTSLLETCVVLPAAPDRLGCADSVGHAIWELEGEFAAATDRCFTLTGSTDATAVSEACLSGVFMQFYRPVAPSGREGEWSAPVSNAGVAELCLALPVTREPACAEAAHYTFSDELKRLRDDVVEGALDPEEGFPVLLEEALDFCDRFSTAGARRCTDASARYFLQALRGLAGVDPRAAVCDVLPVSHRERCAATAAALRLPA